MRDINECDTEGDKETLINVTHRGHRWGNRNKGRTQCKHIEYIWHVTSPSDQRSLRSAGLSLAASPGFFHLGPVGPPGQRRGWQFQPQFQSWLRSPGTPSPAGTPPEGWTQNGGLTYQEMLQTITPHMTIMGGHTFCATGCKYKSESLLSEHTAGVPDLKGP